MWRSLGMALLLVLLIGVRYHDHRLNPKRCEGARAGPRTKSAPGSCRRVTAPPPTETDRTGRTLGARSRSEVRNASRKSNSSGRAIAAAATRTALDLCRADRRAPRIRRAHSARQ